MMTEQPLVFQDSVYTPDELAALRTTTPHKVDLIGTLPGGREAERAIHQLLKHLRHQFEWFRLTPGLRKAITEACHD